jgi:hypothetical protein
VRDAWYARQGSEKEQHVDAPELEAPQSSQYLQDLATRLRDRGHDTQAKSIHMKHNSLSLSIKNYLQSIIFHYVVLIL